MNYYDIIIEINNEYYLAKGFRTSGFLFFPPQDVVYELDKKLSITPCPEPKTFKSVVESGIDEIKRIFK